MADIIPSILLTIAGLISSLLSYHDYKAELHSAICSANDQPTGCKLVYMIPEALILGRIHLSQLAPAYFTIQLALALLTLAGLHSLMQVYKILWLAGAVTIPYLIYLEAAKARAICIWCTIMHIVIVTQVIILYLL